MTKGDIQNAVCVIAEKLEYVATNDSDDNFEINSKGLITALVVLMEAYETND